jgi:hypothetical protein
MEERGEITQRKFFLSLRFEVTDNDAAATCLIITQDNSVTALQSICLAKMSLERAGAIVTLGRKANPAEFIKEHEPKLGPFVTESRDIVETFI